MSKTSFQTRIILDSAYSPDGMNIIWVCGTTIQDMDGVYTGLDVQIGDVIAVDTSGYEPGTFTFYAVSNILTPSATNPELELTYMATNDNTWGAPLLDYSTGILSTISRPSSHLGLLPVVSKDTQGISDKFTEYVQNYNFTRILDNQSNNQTVPNFPKTNGDTTIISKGMVVYIDPNDETKVLRASAADYSKSRAAGLSVTPTALASTALAIQCEGTFELPAAAWDTLTGDVGGLKAGKEYFLSDAILGGLIAPPNVNAAAVTKLGKAVSSTVLDLNIEPPIML